MWIPLSACLPTVYTHSVSTMPVKQCWHTYISVMPDCYECQHIPMYFHGTCLWARKCEFWDCHSSAGEDTVVCSLGIPYLPECKMTLIEDELSKIKHLLIKKKFTIPFIHLKHKACHILCTFTIQCRCLHLHSLCVPSSSSHSLLTFHHHISSSVPSTELDIQHFLKPFTVTSGEMQFQAVMIHTD